jgi:ankyrin repeat protein
MNSNSIDTISVDEYFDIVTNIRYNITSKVLEYLVKYPGKILPPVGCSTSILILALECKSIHVVETILDHSACNVMIKTSDENTALLYAIDNAFSINIINKIIQKNNNVLSQKNRDGNTALMKSVLYHNTDLFNLILGFRYYEHIGLTNKQTKTALMIEVSKNYNITGWFFSSTHVYIIKKLIETNHSRPDYIDDNGQTALIHTVINKNYLAAKTILECLNQPQSQITDIHGNNAFGYAIYYNDKDMIKIFVDLFKNRDSDINTQYARYLSANNTPADQANNVSSANNNNSANNAPSANNVPPANNNNSASNMPVHFVKHPKRTNNNFEYDFDPFMKQTYINGLEEKQTCPICLELIKSFDIKKLHIAKCGHVYCDTDIIYLYDKKECAVCRKKYNR